MENPAAATETNQMTETSSRYITEIPTIYHEQIFGPDVLDGENGRRSKGRVLGFEDAVMIGFGGPRGAGKTMSLAFVGIKARALGLPVWSNVPIKFHYIDYKGTFMTLESKPLLFKDIFALSDELQGGWIIIDEYQYFLPSGGWNATQNKLINAFNDQIRKNSLSIAFSSKTYRRIDITGREETDLWIDCHDAYFSDNGYTRKQKGEVIYWNIMDMSGVWTGRMFEHYPVIHRRRLFSDILKGSYDTRKRIDFIEAMRGVKLDLEKTVITDKEDKSFNYEQMEQQLTDIFHRVDKIRPAELYEGLGVTGNYVKGIIKQMLADQGIGMKNIHGYNYYSRKVVDDPILANK